MQKGCPKAPFRTGTLADTNDPAFGLRCQSFLASFLSALPLFNNLFGQTHRVFSASNCLRLPGCRGLRRSNPTHASGFFTGNANLVGNFLLPNARNFINFAASQAKA